MTKLYYLSHHWCRKDPVSSFVIYIFASYLSQSNGCVKVYHCSVNLHFCKKLGMLNMILSFWDLSIFYNKIFTFLWHLPLLIIKSFKNSWTWSSFRFPLLVSSPVPGLHLWLFHCSLCGSTSVSLDTHMPAIRHPCARRSKSPSQSSWSQRVSFVFP